jgi:DNA-binding IclR family transcriptional regulator
MEKKTPNTVTEPLSLKKEIILSRQRGFGMTQCEFNTSENAISCAIEQNHQPVGFITVSGPAYRFTLESMLEYAPRMLELCADIQNILNEQSK